jgi:hypothetical protein
MGSWGKCLLVFAKVGIAEMVTERGPAAVQLNLSPIAGEEHDG